ncbi:MAG: hypothetical protein PVJ10_03075 [Thiohalophilus sp.]
MGRAQPVIRLGGMLRLCLFGIRLASQRRAPRQRSDQQSCANKCDAAEWVLMGGLLQHGPQGCCSGHMPRRAI